MRLVPINCVKEGAYLGKTLFDNDGRVLLREGVKLTAPLIKGIKNVHIFTVYINDEYSYNEIEDVINPELRQKSVKIVKEVFSHFEKTASSQINNNNSKQKDLIKQQQGYLKAICELSMEIIEEITTQKDLLINLVDIKSMDNYTYQHCVNVAILSLVLGIRLKLTRQELYDLCVGALLHDIGKVFIQESILQKPGKLTPDEFAIIKEHTTKGYDYLKGYSSDITAPARIIALQHHEKANGNGYPEKKTGDKINKLSRIVTICDVYDALTSDRPYRRAMSPNEAIEFIMASGGTQFDYQMVKVFAKTIIPYPEGTLVKLSTEDIAVVEKVNPNFALRPSVKVVKSNVPENIGSLFNLENKLDIVIAGIQYEIPE